MVHVFGLLKKHGWDAMKYIGGELKKEMIKKGVGYVVDHGADLIKYSGNTLHH